MANRPKQVAELIMAIDCDKLSFTWAVVRSTDLAYLLVDRNKYKLPANTPRGESLHWLYLEIQRLVREHSPDRAVLKRAELGGRGTEASLDHAELDGVVLAALGSTNVPSTSIKWATIASRLGQGRSREGAIKTVSEMTEFRGIPNSHLSPIAAAITG